MMCDDNVCGGRVKGCQAKEVSQCPLPSFYQNSVPAECFFCHITKMIDDWQTRKKGKYLETLGRLFGKGKISEEIKKKINVEFLLYSAFIFHDLGKLTNAYLKSRGFFRHEIFSTYAYLRFWDYLFQIFQSEIFQNGPIIKKFLKDAFTLSVALHHESILLGSVVNRAGEDRLTVSLIEYQKRKVNEYIGNNIFVLPEAGSAVKELFVIACRVSGFHFERLQEYLSNYLDWLGGEHSIDDVYKSFTDFFLRLANIGNKEYFIKMRMFGGAILSQLVWCDYSSAQSRADNEENKGFWSLAKID